MLRTDDAGRWTMDAGRWTMDTGRWTMDAGPSTPYYKLTGELKIKYISVTNNMYNSYDISYLLIPPQIKRQNKNTAWLPLLHC